MCYAHAPPSSSVLREAGEKNRGKRGPLVWCWGEGRTRTYIWIKGQAYASSLILGEEVHCLDVGDYSGGMDSCLRRNDGLGRGMDSRPVSGMTEESGVPLIPRGASEWEVCKNPI